jgi:mannosyltransferase OCH1-like enzyme
MRGLLIFVIILILLLIFSTVCNDFMLDTFYPRIHTLSPGQEYYHPINNRSIPKIIHQLAPEDKSKWPQTWFKGQASTKKYFPEPEYQHIMWTDEKIHAFVQNEFPQYWDVFQSYPYLINKIDMVRYMILHKYGGIYIDMDFIIKKNFYDILKPGHIYLIKSIWFFNEIHQNSLMATPQDEEFWINLIDIATRAMKDSKIYNKYINKKKSLFTITMTGPRLLDSLVSHSNKDKIRDLPYYGLGHHKNTSTYVKGALKDN